MPKLTAKDLVRFNITVAEANALHITIDDLKGITEIIPNKKYRIIISNGFKIDGSRDRVSETFNGTLIQAINRKKEIKLEIEEGNINADANSDFEVFSKLYCNYLEEKVLNNQLEFTTYEGYYGLLNNHILPFFKKMIIKNINERHIEAWIAKLEKTKTKKGTFLHPTTIAHAFKLLNNMFNFAKLDRILKENPCEFVRKKPTEKTEERECFSIEEMDYIKELLSTSNIRLKTALFLVMDTGCRREEIIGLKWKDIDFINNKIDINKGVVSTSTKTRINTKRIREKGVKSSHSKRRIGVPKVCIDLLTQYRNFKKDSGLKTKDTDYVFTNWDNNKVWDPNRFTAEWCTFRKEHNITKNVPLHGIRHSNATYLLSIGVPRKDVAKRLGHSVEVLDRTYTHSSEDDDDKIVEQMENRTHTEIQKNQVQVSTASIISVIAGYIDNEYKVDNYKLLDFITGDRVDKDNLNHYLESCQNYLLSIYPILDIFQDNNIISNEIIFKEKLENFVSFMGDTKPVLVPNDAIEIMYKNI